MTTKLAPVPLPPYSAAEVARMLGKAPAVVRTAIELGQLPGYRVGRNFEIPREAFARWQRGEWQPVRPADFIRRRKAS